MDQIWAVKAVWTQISIDYSNLQTLPISILITYFHINYSNLLLLRKSTSHLHQPTIQSPRNLQQLTWLTTDRRRLPACTERFVTCAKECVSAALRLILSALRFSLSRCIWPPGLMLFTMCPCAGSWDFHFCWKSLRKLSLVLLATSISTKWYGQIYSLLLWRCLLRPGACWRGACRGSCESDSRSESWGPPL